MTSENVSDCVSNYCLLFESGSGGGPALKQLALDLAEELPDEPKDHMYFLRSTLGNDGITPATSHHIVYPRIKFDFTIRTHSNILRL